MKQQMFKFILIILLWLIWTTVVGLEFPSMSETNSYDQVNFEEGGWKRGCKQVTSVSGVQMD